MVKVFGKFGEVAGSDKALGEDDGGGVDLSVTILLGLKIEHEVDQGSNESGSVAGVDDESGTADLGSSGKVDHFQFGGNVVMGLEVAGRLSAPVADFDVVIGGFAIGGCGVRKVGEFKFDGAEFFFEFFDPGFQGFDGLFEGSGLGFGGFGPFFVALGHELADGFADSVGFGEFVFEIVDGGAPFGIDTKEFIDRGFDAFTPSPFANEVGVFSYQFSIQHGLGFTFGSGVGLADGLRCLVGGVGVEANADDSISGGLFDSKSPKGEIDGVAEFWISVEMFDDDGGKRLGGVGVVGCGFGFKKFEKFIVSDIGSEADSPCASSFDSWSL